MSDTVTAVRSYQ